MLQTKKFLFFNQETLPTGEGAASSSAQLQALEMTCCVAGRGCLLFGDAAGHVTFVDHSGHRILSLMAHGHRVTALAHSCSQDMFVSVGDGHDPRSPQRKEQCKRVAAAAVKRAKLGGGASSPHGAAAAEDGVSDGDGEGLAVVKIWRVSQDTLSAVCIHEFHAFGPGVPWQETAITTVAASDDCTSIALGLCTGQILLFRASSLPSAAALPGHSYQRFRPALLQKEEASPVTFLGFCPDATSRRPEGGSGNGGGHTLFATTRSCVRAHSVVPQDRSGSGATDRPGAPFQPRPAVVLADEAGSGCEPGCATLMRARGELVVGRAEAVYCYSAEEPRRCYAIPDRKRRLLSFGHYLLLATENKGGKTVVSVFDTRKGTQYIAFNMVLKPSPGARRGIGGGVASAARGGAGGSKGVGIGGRDTGDASSGGGGGGVGGVAKGEVPSVLYFAHDGDSVFVVTTEHVVYRLSEKDTNTKLDILVRKHLYPMAIQLSINSNLPQQQQMEIHHMYGDHLYEKGSFDAAIEQYIKTIGSLNPSVVIGKFLDAHHVQNLMAYLEAIHRTCLPDGDAVEAHDGSGGAPGDANGTGRSSGPHPLHTTLLLQCYTKLKDVDKLRQFILGGEGAVATFDVATAINVLRATNSELALALARKHREHDWVFRILLEECDGDEGMLEDAILYMLGLPAAQVVAQLQRWGKTLVEFLPDQMTDLLAALCTGCYRPLAPPSDGDSDGDGLGACSSSSRGGGVDDTQCDCKPEDFVHLLVNHPRHLRAFLEVIVAEQPSTSAMVGNTLLELLLQECDWDDPEERDRAVLELLDNHRARYDKEHALVLVQIHECKVGELYLYEKLHRHDMVVQHHMETGNRRGMIDECKLRGGNEPALWMQVLRYLAKQRDAEGMESEIADVLQHLEQERHLAPLPVVQILQQSPHVTLGTVRDYLTNWIGHQQDISRDDVEDLSAARAESRELKARVAEMEKRLQRLEKGDVHHEEDLEYDEYDQEEDKRLLSIRKALEQKAGDHEEFARSMAQAPDGFDVVAEYFGKGIVDVCLDEQRPPQHQ